MSNELTRFTLPPQSRASLASVTTTSLPEGTLVQVTDVAQIYALFKTGSYTVDGLLVLAGSGGGYWVSTELAPRKVGSGATDACPGNAAVRNTTAELHVYADGVLGLDTNDGLQKSAGTGGSFSVLAGIVTFTGTGAAWTSADIGRLITINYSTSSANNGSFIITGASGNQVTYANANGVTEAMPAGGKWAVSSPKLTIQAALDVLPTQIAHNSCLHLSGTFTGYGSAFVEKDVIKNKTLLVDGGTDLTVVADNAGSPWTPDIFSTSSIGLTTAGWTVDAYAGYFVEIVSGTCAGQTRMIQGNTATTITPCRNFNVSPDGTSLFRIVRPKTTLAGAGVLMLQNKGSGYLQLQSVYTSGNSVLMVGDSVGFTYLSHVVTNSTNAGNAVGIYQSNYVNILGSRINPYTFVGESAAIDSQAGISTILWAPGSFGIYCRSCPIVYFEQSFVKFLYYNRILSPIVQYGTRVLHFTLTNTFNHVWIFPLLDSATGYATTKFGGFANPAIPGRKFPGIYAAFSSLTIGKIDISNCTNHAIEMCGNSYLHIADIATTNGTVNPGAAIYAHANATVTIKGGVTPTLNGTIGILSTDGTTQFASWSDIQTGGGVVDGAELVRAKVYTPVYQQF